MLRETLAAEAMFADPDDPHAIARLPREMSSRSVQLASGPSADILERYDWRRTAKFIRAVPVHQP